MFTTSALYFVIILVLLQKVKATVKSAGLLEKWNQRIRIAMGSAIALLGIDILFKEQFEFLTIWIWPLFPLAIIYVIHKEADLQKRRPMAYGVLPLIVVQFLSSFTEYVLPSVYKEWDSYFSTATWLALAWMAATWFNANKQEKVATREAEKNRLEAEMNKAIATRKVQLEGEVAERTAELIRQKEELQDALSELRATQDQLVQQEKLASLGELTAGIAHEIQNPLNFVNNFSEVSIELLDELETELNNGDKEEVIAIAADIKQNLLKISQHGKRADGIVKGMLQHSRKSTGQKEPTDINSLADEYLRLSYHGLRAKDKSFNATLKIDFYEGLQPIDAIPQELGRVMLNMFNNAFYAVSDRKKKLEEGYEPTVSLSTLPIQLADGAQGVEIKIRDNGSGIPKKILDKIYQPFFTTKPAGEGTGLGLSLSYDIVTKVHGGELKVETKEGEFTEFTIQLPIS